MKKYRLVVISIILILSLCSCGAKIAVPGSAATPSITASSAPEPFPASTPSPVPSLAAAETPVPTPSTKWGAKFLGKFTDGEAVQTENSYKSEHVNVTVNKVQQDNVTYYAADIYITDIKFFIAPFSGGGYQNGARKFVYNIARELSAVIAINGDYYTRNAGPVLRDGVLYRNEDAEDILVMYKDGTMKTYDKDEYDKDTLDTMKDSVWQIWTFGPMLLKDGEPMSEFNMYKGLGGLNPRAAVGYYEPGHYVFVIVDGRQPGYSVGLGMKDLSKLMYDLGCCVAFNLDGGGTAQMAYMGEWINQSSVHRKTVDAICIVDEPSP